MPVNILDADAALREQLGKERQDVREVGAATAETTIGALGESKQSLDAYAAEQKNINKQSDAALTKLRSSIDNYNELQNAGFFERIGNSFAGIFDPTKDIEAVGNKVRQNQQQLQLAEIGRQQSKDKLDTSLKQGQAEIDIAGQELKKEVTEMELVSGEIAQRRADERARLEQQQTFLTTADLPALEAQRKAGNLTDQQVLEEKNRRIRQAKNMRQLDINLQVQERNLAELTRVDILDDMPKHQLQAALKEAQKPENGGVYKLGNFMATGPELKERIDKFTKVDIGEVSDVITTTEAASVGSSVANKLSSMLGIDTEGLDAADQFALIAKRSDVYNPEEQSLIRQMQGLRTAIDDAGDDNVTQAQLSEVYLKKAGDLINVMNEKVRTQFPSKTTSVAIDQFLNNGKIADSLGAQELTMSAALSGAPTGSNLYDDILVKMQPLASQIATKPELADIKGFAKESSAAADKATHFAYTTGLYETLALVAADPEFEQLGLQTALAHQRSALYGGNGKFSLNNLGNYFEGAFEDGGSQWAVFERAMAKHLPKYAKAAFGFTGSTPEGSVAIASMNKMLFDNAPMRNFNVYVRSQLHRQGQRRFSRLR